MSDECKFVTNIETEDFPVCKAASVTAEKLDFNAVQLTVSGEMSEKSESTHGVYFSINSDGIIEVELYTHVNAKPPAKSPKSFVFALIDGHWAPVSGEENE